VSENRYLLDNQEPQAGQRFDALAELFNPSTFRHMEAIGLTRGWRVWEVGAGGASVPAWIAEQTGSYVLATDIDTSWLASENSPYEVRQHDIGRDPVPQGLFDLVHARLVLVHVPQRAAALATMISALRPGGWLLIEEADPGLQPLVCPDEFGPEQELANRLKTDFRTLMAERGVNLRFGRELPRLLRNAGLLDVRADAYFPMGGPACNELERATVEQIAECLVGAGLASEADIRRHLANVATGQLDLATSPMVSAWARTSGPD
jgi:SAM-dependent methyltransferase